MITNKSRAIKEKKSPLLAKIKSEPTFFQVLWQFFNPKGPLLRAGGRAKTKPPFRPPRLEAEAKRTISSF